MGLRARIGGRLLLSVLMGTAVLLEAAERPAAAQTARVARFDIPAGPLSGALAAFGQQSGLQVTYLPDLAAGRTSPGFSGEASAEQALVAILRNSGLAYSFTNATTVAISDPGSSGSSGVMTLSPVEVTAPAAGAHSGSGYLGTPDWVYETPSGLSVISREAIVDSPVRNARDLLDAVAGVYANRSEAQSPGIAVNIRGLQDQDRIVMMIDGARQSFQRNSHGSTQRTFVDTAFLRTVDIEKTSTAGVGSLGSLGGSVNFRTLIADDLIPIGDTWGAEMNLTTGTNAYNFEGSLVGSVRLAEAIAITAGVSYRDIGAYEIGRNGTINQGATYNGDVLYFSGQEVFGTLLKAEIELFEDVGVTLGWLRNESEYSTGAESWIASRVTEDVETVVNNTFTAAIDWNPDSDLIDLKVRAYLNHLMNEETMDDTGPYATTGSVPLEYKMVTLGGSLENTSRFDIAVGNLSFNYGFEAFWDEGETIVDGDYIGDGGLDWAPSLTGGTPSGERTVAGGFASMTFERDDWLMISGGIRYDYYDISGSVNIFGARVAIREEYCASFNANGTCRRWGTRVVGYEYPSYDAEVDKSGDAWLPSATLAVKPFDWLQLFVGYSKSFRPPTVMESFLNGGHAGSSIGSYAPNPYLDPERGETWEFGFNILKDGIFRDDDSARLKLVGFYREVEDYIALGRIRHPVADRQYDSYVNLDGTTFIRGLEIEASYDARSFYVGGAFTWNEVNWADTFTLDGRTIYLESGIGPTVLFVQPKYRLVLDGGVRLFDERLTLGGRVTRVTPTEPTLGSLLPETTFGMKDYTVFDIYASYAFDDSIKLRAAVTNLTDEAYVAAMGASYYAAPGATATISLQVKF